MVPRRARYNSVIDSAYKWRFNNVIIKDEWKVRWHKLEKSQRYIKINWDSVCEWALLVYFCFRDIFYTFYGCAHTLSGSVYVHEEIKWRQAVFFSSPRCRTKRKRQTNEHLLFIIVVLLLGTEKGYFLNNNTIHTKLAQSISHWKSTTYLSLTFLFASISFLLLSLVVPATRFT